MRGGRASERDSVQDWNSVGLVLQEFLLSIYYHLYPMLRFYDLSPFMLTDALALISVCFKGFLKIPPIIDTWTFL